MHCKRRYDLALGIWQGKRVLWFLACLVLNQEDGTIESILGNLQQNIGLNIKKKSDKIGKQLTGFFSIAKKPTSSLQMGRGLPSINSSPFASNAGVPVPFSAEYLSRISPLGLVSDQDPEMHHIQAHGGRGGLPLYGEEMRFLQNQENDSHTLYPQVVGKSQPSSPFAMTKDFPHGFLCNVKYPGHSSGPQHWIGGAVV
jgi:hypothetical protein